jgi:MFS family permease
MTAGYTCFIVMMSLGRLAGDRMVHRFGYINMLQFNGILMAAGFAIASVLPDLWFACLGFLLVGFGDATIVPIIYSLAGKSRTLPAYAIASVTMIGYVGFVVNPLVVGFISDSVGMRWAFGLMGMYAICITLLSMRVRKFQPTMKD